MQNYTSQAENLASVRQCLQKYKSSKSDNQTLNSDLDEQKKLEELVRSHSNFSKFVQPVDFDDYVKQYTLLKPVTVTANGTSHSDQTNDDLVLEITKAVTNPAIMERVLDMFLASNKL